MTDPQPPAPHTVTDARYLDLVGELARLEARGVRGDIRIGPFAAFCLIGSIQMVTRHPDLPLATTARILRPLADRLTDWVVAGYFDPADSDDMAELIAKGWDPTHDVTLPATAEADPE